MAGRRSSNLIALAEALVHRYPEAMTAFRQARITERHAEILVGGLDELELAREPLPALQGASSITGVGC